MEDDLVIDACVWHVRAEAPEYPEADAAFFFYQTARRVAVYVTSSDVVSRIRAAGLTVKVLKTADQVREENERIDRSFSGMGGAGGHPR